MRICRKQKTVVHIVIIKDSMGVPVVTIKNRIRSERSTVGLADELHSARLKQRKTDKKMVFTVFIFTPDVSSTHDTSTFWFKIRCLALQGGRSAGDAEAFGFL